MNGDELTEGAARARALGAPAERDAVMPDAFIAPHALAVHVDAHEVPDDAGRGWVLVRFETVHGSFVAFLTPDVALAHAAQVDAAATRARLLVV